MSFQDTSIKSTPEEQAKHLAAIGVMPSPVVPDLRKATTAELQEEVIFLRLFVASQMIGFKELAIKLNEVELRVKRLESPPSTDVVYAGEAEQAEMQRFYEEEDGEEQEEIYDDTPQPNNNLYGNPYR